MQMKISAINRFFNILFGALAMLMVALVSAFITMRLAIHGHEVKVPDLADLTISEASRKVSHLGLSLNLENRFYSPTTAPGRVLAQSPAPGATVRRDWAVRITESLGPQQVAIPNLVGQTERTASINIRRVGLDVGAIAYAPAPGTPGLVIAQTPTPNASGVDSPRVSLLLSAPEESSAPAAFVMPSLAGLTLSGAVARVSAIGLRIVSVEDLNAPTTPAAIPATSPQPTPSPQPAKAPTPPATPSPAATAPATGAVIAQTPAAGHRVAKGDPVHITMTD